MGEPEGEGVRGEGALTSSRKPVQVASSLWFRDHASAHFWSTNVLRAFTANGLGQPGQLRGVQISRFIGSPAAH